MERYAEQARVAAECESSYQAIDMVPKVLVDTGCMLLVFGTVLVELLLGKDLNATLSIGNVSVLLGGANDMNGKLSELSNILPRIKDLDGTLDLSDYDPTVPNRMYSFRRR